MGCASDRLKLSWELAQGETVCGILDKRFLSSHRRASPVSLPFLLFCWLPLFIES